jgi:hypothetical protein
LLSFIVPERTLGLAQPPLVPEKDALRVTSDESRGAGGPERSMAFSRLWKTWAVSLDTDVLDVYKEE